ncbi:putative disease resistance protein RGA3 [Rosa sericea]
MIVHPLETSLSFQFSFSISFKAYFKNMAEALVNVLLERLATITMDKVQGELNLVTGVEEEVKTLTSNLTAIQAVLKDAEARQAVDAGVRHWLHQLNEVSDEMDNVLDEWSYQVLKQRMEGENVKKVCCPSSSSCFRFGQVSQLNNRRHIAVRIEKLNEKLALIDKEKQRFNLQNNPPSRGPEIPRQETTCFPSDRIFGREKEKNIVLSKLLGESSQDCEIPLIIPIVGMGGMGKTTLSRQLAYNDENVKTHFDKRIWVCVSDPFIEVKIARAIVEGLDKDNTSKTSDSLQILMECIHSLIEGKKFLLVLDDVWNPRHTQWEELIKPFCHGAVGSRVLVTTRNEEVATLMKATAHVIYMKQLSEEFCSSLFYYNAGIDTGGEFEKFQNVGEKIVKKCDGLPLAAKTLGSLMREKKTLKEWEDVLNSKLWELEDVEQQVFRPLLLSYNDLTAEIRNCLLYCVIFPKDYVYDRDNLVELWMSQNYLNMEGSREMERLGQKYFDKLVMRYFFQEVEVNKYGEINCKIHDIIHDFMMYMTKNEYLIVNFRQPSLPTLDDEFRHLNEKIRHLTLINSYRAPGNLDKFRSCENLRTLVVLDSYARDISIGWREILQWKYVRTLTWLESGICAIPNEISGLIHLRYLDLSENGRLEELPDTMGSLYSLQTLRLVKCDCLKKVDLGRLINLRHLSVRGCRYLELRGIERLTNLQTLDEFYVQYGDEGNKLEHLKNLNQLQGRLTITYQGGPGARDAAIMVNKAHLLHLVLNVEGALRWNDLMALQPPPGLESLGIDRYRGIPLSTEWWSSLHSLRLLTLSRCNFLPALGNLASLESLNMKYVSVRKVGVEFLGIHDQDQSEASRRRHTSFPKLKQLTFDDMPIWEEWEGVKEDSEKMAIIMPRLSQLTISGCYSLEALPEFLWKTPLQKLHISKSRILQKLYRQGIGEQRAKISHISTINVEEP